MRRLALLALVLAPSIPRPSGACEVAPGHGGDHRIDPQHADDVAPPGAVTADYELVFDDGDEGGCSSTCTGDYSHVRVTLAARDDRTPSARLAYQFSIVAGQPPRGIDLPFNPLFIGYDGAIELGFSGEDRDFGFVLEIRAVDLNGNLGPPTMLNVFDPD